MKNKTEIFIAVDPELLDTMDFYSYTPGWEAYANVTCWDGPGSPTVQWMNEALERAEVLVIGWGTPSLVDALADWSPERSPLRLVAHTAGTVKHLLPLTALERGLLVVHANESLAEAVAEFTIGAFIAMLRQMFVDAGRYKAHRPALSWSERRELTGRTVGIIGASAIGRRVIELLAPWRVKILLYDPYVTAETAAAMNVEKVELLDLFRRSDIVSLHAPITPETINMIRGEHFRAMQDGAVFINTARGVLIDQNALLDELKTGRISALLDVTDPTEPLPDDSPFFDLENCVLIPHMAANTLETRQRQGRYTAEDILAYLEGRPLKHRILPERWKTMA